MKTAVSEGHFCLHVNTFYVLPTSKKFLFIFCPRTLFFCQDIQVHSLVGGVDRKALRVYAVMNYRGFVWLLSVLFIP